MITCLGRVMECEHEQDERRAGRARARERGAPAERVRDPRAGAERAREAEIEPEVIDLW